MTTHQDGNEYDVIFAGGGTAACVAAGRLAQADPELSILLVEGGKNNLNDPLVTNPAIYLAHLAPDSQTAIFYKSEAEEALNGREAIVPCGGMLGGGSSINFMMYTRGQKSDYDAWNMEGWDGNSVLQYMKKLETYHPDHPAIDKNKHGYEGPVNISVGTHNPTGPQDDVLAAAAALGKKEIVDLQDLTANDGFSRWARYVGPDGKRQDAAHRYIHPLMADGSHKNLHLLLESKVSRVLFEGKRAVGVEYTPAQSYQPTTALSTQSSPKTVRAKKMVVVSAGALGTPQILERSGIGNAELLKKLEIPVVVDNPDVGEHYQDHHLLLYPYKTNLGPDETLDGLLSGRLDFVKAMQEQNPILGWNGIDVCSKLRPSEEEVKQMSPEFQEVWNKDFKEQVDRPLMLMGVVSSFLGDHKVLPAADPPVQYATMGAYTAYPYSRGEIHIVSKDVHTPASFHTGFLREKADLDAQVWAYKFQRELYRRTNAFAGELEMGHPKFKEGSKAALDTGVKDGARFKSVEDRKAVKNLEYDADDDKAIEEWIRANLNTTWHSCGTCRMAPREKGGVVDEKLNVYGVEGLKLADLSIMPENVGANTNNTALLVGEKAGVLIGEALGIKV